MSVQAMTWAWKTECPNASAKLVLMCLANYADKDGSCFPGQKTIAEECGLSLRTVKTAAQALEDAGLIKRQRRIRDDGTRTSDEYFLQFTDKVQISYQVTDIKVQNTSGQGANSAPQYKPNGLSEPVREPSETRAREKLAIFEQWFDEFWCEYPHKVGKAAAKKAFGVVWKRTDVIPSELMDALRRYKRQKPEWANWCNPATWLNQERWKDEPAEVQNGNYHNGFECKAEYNRYVMKTTDENILSFDAWRRQHGQG